MCDSEVRMERVLEERERVLEAPAASMAARGRGCKECGGSPWERVPEVRRKLLGEGARSAAEARGRGSATAAGGPWESGSTSSHCAMSAPLSSSACLKRGQSLLGLPCAPSPRENPSSSARHCPKHAFTLQRVKSAVRVQLECLSAPPRRPAARSCYSAVRVPLSSTSSASCTVVL